MSGARTKHAPLAPETASTDARSLFHELEEGAIFLRTSEMAVAIVS